MTSKPSGRGTVVLAASLLALTLPPVSAQQPGRDADGCGWYIVLGCSRSKAEAGRTFMKLGGPGMGGGAGSAVLETAGVRGFKPGFFCVADGPYRTVDDARSVAWVEAVPDAYVKRGCR